MIGQLNAAELETIMDLAAIAESLKTPLMLVGANARRLTFDIPFAFTSSRTTQDWDFAAPMATWNIYFCFYQLAVQEPEAKFRPGGSTHRIIHLHTGTLVDLIPFGGVSDGQGRIHWPQSKQVMSVLGFEEAFASSVIETLPNGLEIRLITPPMLAALKIVAFADRKEEYSRDLKDLWFIMERYARPPAHEKRVFDELPEHIADPAYYEHLDSVLLGWDIGRQCGPATLEALEAILEELAHEECRYLDALLSRTGDLDEQRRQRQRIAGEFGWIGKGITLAKKVSKIT